MPLEREDIERALVAKLGFQRMETDHRVFILEVAGKLLKTKTSHGTKHKTIGDELVIQMARQLSIPRGFFVELVRCTNSQNDYVRLLVERGIIPATAMNGPV